MKRFTAILLSIFTVFATACQPPGRRLCLKGYGQDDRKGAVNARNNNQSRRPLSLKELYRCAFPTQTGARRQATHKRGRL